MEWNPGAGSGAVDEINDICNSDDSSYPLVSKARRTNQALDTFFGLAFESDGRWNYDDPNWGTVPIQTLNLQSGVQAYDIGAFTSEVLYALRWELLDPTGNSLLLSRLLEENVRTGLPSYQTASGTPVQYGLVGTKIYLYPIPNYNSVGGLRVYLSRNKDPILSSDTTRDLPVPSLFVRYICNLASLPYLIEYQKPQKNDVATEILQDEIKIRNYFFSREKSVNKGMKKASENNR